MRSFSQFLNHQGHKETENSQVNAPTGTIGLNRSDMPQIAKDDIPEFLAYLKAKGVSVLKSNRLPTDISFTQIDLNGDKMDAMKDAPSRRYIISKDNYLLDGHHGVAAALKYHSNQVLPVTVVNLPIMDLIKAAHEFPKSFKKSVNEQWI